MPTKQFKIKTGESLRDAYLKCPHLISVPPDYSLYMKASAAMVAIISEYSPKVQRFSIDECFAEICLSGDDSKEKIVTLSLELKDRIFEELGFSVNIGLSTVKLLSKMASDFEKPNKLHTLWLEEIETKMWPLPVGDMFLVGSRTESKLLSLGITTIGELALADINMLYTHLKSHGYLIHAYANGVDSSPVRKSNRDIVKGMGNSTTISFDIEKREEASLVIISLAESIGMRLRQASLCAGLVSISIRSFQFTGGSHQRKISVATDSTTYIHKIAMELFDELWDKQPIRKIGLRVSDLYTNDYVQLSLLEEFDFEKQKALDKAIDKIRDRYGSTSIFRSSFLHSGLRPVTGGIPNSDDDEYPLMTSIL